MTKTSSFFQRNIVFTMLICLTFKSCSTRNYYSNLDLSSQTLNPVATGFKATGNAVYDRFGNSVSTAGDIDNDGYDDIIIGAPWKNSQRGAVYVIYGGQQSSFLNVDLSTTTLNPLTTGFTITGNAANDQFGLSVSTAGDIDNDGYDDIIIGAPYGNGLRGGAYVIYGGPKSTRTNINLSSTLLYPGSTGFMITGNEKLDQLGYSVSTAGDINNDGYDDIIIGVPSINDQQVVYVIYGGPKSSMSNRDFSSGATLNPSTTGFMITGSVGGFGFSVSTTGDINNDGYDDIIIGASLKGAAYVIYGHDKSAMSNINLYFSTSLNPSSTGFMITGSSYLDQLGYSVSRAGDINNDGYDDIIVGAPYKNSRQGAVYVIYGGTKSSMSNLDFSSGATLDPTSTGFMITANAVGDYFGVSVSTAGDINNDGYDDIIVGAYGKNSYQGAAYVIYGGAKPTMSNIDLSSTILDPTSTGFMITGNAARDYFGYSVSIAGDINNDGYDDIIVGAYYKDNYQGAAYMIYGSCSANCNQCSSEPVCTECQSSYLMYQSECFASCPDATFAHTATTCQDCSANCNHCSSSSVCTECKNSYFMYQSECFASCPDATFASTTTTCQDCSADCKYCSSESICTECQSSYLMYQSECFAACPDTTFAGTATTCQDCPADCKHCSSTSVCTECQNSYLLHNSKCFVACPEATFASSATTCQDCPPDCKQCSSGSVCIECQSPYLMYQSECFATCPEGTLATSSTTCEDCPSDCKHCSSTSVCTECQSSYLMYHSECFATCPDTTFADTAITCQDCPPNCKQCSSESVCTECESSYLMYNSECFARCPEATFASTATTCQDCSTNCNHCSSSSVCTECKDSYLMYQSECFASCPEGTLATSPTICEDCPTNCNHCTSPSVCTECKNSYLMYQSECFASCPEGTLATSPTTCEDCPADCKHCSSASICTECQSSYFLHNSKCFSSCPEATIATSSNTCEDCPAHCNHCSSTSVCTECQSPYRLYQSECVDSCPDKMFLSTTTCEDCPTNCNHCTSPSLCTECVSPFVLYESQCLTSCPKGMFNSDNVCKDCPSYCSSCTSEDSCQVCYEGFTLSNSLCVAPVSESVPSSTSHQEVQEKAIQRISSAAKVISSAVCVGRTVAPFAILASKTVQNTRYLNLSVTNDLSEVYQTWDKDLIPWKVPNSFSNNEDDFESSPTLFARYDTGSPFLVNFWPTFINIAGGLTLFITCFVLQKLLEKSKHENGVFLMQKLVAGSFSFTLIQAYVYLDDILFYLVLDIKTNPLNSFFSCASLITALIFLAFGCLLVLFNLWTVKKYQKTKKQELKDIKVFNQKNKYWELFYSDFNDNNLWTQSFFAILIIRSTLSSLIITALYDYPLMQTLFLVMMDIVIISFLYFKNPFKTLRGKLAQYFYEITTLLVHLCTFSLSLKPSHTGKSIFATGIIYLNTALIMGAVGLMIFEIYKIISAIIEKKKAARLKERQVVPVENQEIQNLTKSPLNALETDDRKRLNWANQDQTAASPGIFHLLPEATTPNGDVESPIMKPPSRALNRRKHKINSIFPINN